MGGVALAFGFTIAGCSSPPVQDVPPNVSAAIEGLTALPAELDLARSIATRDCLVEKGYDVPFDTTATQQPRDSYVGVVGVFDSEEVATSFGYSTTYRADEADSVDSFRQSLPPSEQAAFDVALMGDPGDQVVVKIGESEAMIGKSGCATEARSAIFGSPESALRVGGFINEVLSEANSNSAKRESLLSESIPQYQECMRSAGYEVEGLRAQNLAGDLFGQYRNMGDPPSADEQALARADFSCQEGVGLRSQLKEQFERDANTWIIANEDRILSLSELLDESLTRANAIING